MERDRKATGTIKRTYVYSILIIHFFSLLQTSNMAPTNQQIQADANASRVSVILIQNLADQVVTLTAERDRAAEAACNAQASYDRLLRHYQSMIINMNSALNTNTRYELAYRSLRALFLNCMDELGEVETFDEEEVWMRFNNINDPMLRLEEAIDLTATTEEE